MQIYIVLVKAGVGPGSRGGPGSHNGKIYYTKNGTLRYGTKPLPRQYIMPNIQTQEKPPIPASAEETRNKIMDWFTENNMQEKIDQYHEQTLNRYQNILLNGGKIEDPDAVAALEEAKVHMRQYNRTMSSVFLSFIHANKTGQNYTKPIFPNIISKINPLNEQQPPNKTISLDFAETTGEEINNLRYNIDEAIAVMNTLITPSLLVGTQRPKFDVTSSRSRFNHVFRACFMQVGAKQLTVMHELGHWLEDQNNNVKQACIEFLNKRTINSQEQLLADIHNNKSYENEVTKPDQFVSPYMGKQYIDPMNGEQYGTEILSMGLQKICYHESLIHLIKNDPEYFDFIYNIIHGNI